MGQRQDRDSTSRVAYDADGDNGLVLSSVYVPEELLGEILCYVDHRTLLNCHLVCHRWWNIIQDYVWRKKAELIFGQSLQAIKDTQWIVYYHICQGKIFEKNLMQNHSGQNGLGKNWQIVRQGGDHWVSETPPVGVPPLPNEPIFEGHQSCFVTSYSMCTKRQIIDLLAMGFSSQILDTFQPPIVVSEWYSARWDCPAIYELFVTLVDSKNKVLDKFQFYDSIDAEKQNEWHFISHEFKNYGPDLRKIVFQHSGKDSLFWAGHYGSKMAGAAVVFKVPREPPVLAHQKRKSSTESLDLDAKMYYADIETDSDEEVLQRAYDY